MHALLAAEPQRDYLIRIIGENEMKTTTLKYRTVLLWTWGRAYVNHMEMDEKMSAVDKFIFNYSKNAKTVDNNMITHTHIKTVEYRLPSQMLRAIDTNKTKPKTE